MKRYIFFLLMLLGSLNAQTPPIDEYKDSIEQVIATSSDSHERFRAKKKLLDLHWYESKSKEESIRYYEDLILDLELNEEWDLAMESTLSLFITANEDPLSFTKFKTLYGAAREKFLNKSQSDLIRLMCLDVDFFMLLKKNNESYVATEKIVKEMEALANKIGTDKAKAVYLFTKGHRYAYFNEREKGLEAYLDLLAILESNNYLYEPWLEKALAYNNTLFLMNFCDPEFAEQMIEKSIAYNRIIGQKLGIVANYATLGKIYSDNRMFKKSNEYLKKTILEAKKINSDRFEMQAKYALANNYLLMKAYVKAEKLFREVLFLLNGLEESFIEVVDVKMSLARTLILQKKKEELNLLNQDFEALLQNKKHTPLALKVDALYFKMCYTALKGNYAESKKYLDELIPLAKSLNDNELISKVYLDWSKFCKDFGKLNEAYEYVSLATNYKDSANIDLVKHKLKLKKLEYRYTNALAVRKVKSKDSPHFSLSKFSLGFNWTTTILLLLLSGVITFIYLGVKRNKSLVHELSTAQGKLELTAQSLNEALQFSNNQFLNNSERLKSKLKIEDDLSKSTLKNNRLLTLNTVREMDLARENMQVFSSLTKGDIVVKPDPVSLNSILNKVGSEVLEANPEFKFHHKIPNHCEIFVDKDQIELVLRNLAYLAVYRSNGEGRLDIIASENAESHILEIDEYCERLPEELIAWYSDPKIQELENFPFKMELTVVRYLLKKNRAKLLVDVGPSGNNLIQIILPKHNKTTDFYYKNNG